MDCKAHRAEKVLEIKAAFFEENCATPAVSAALAAALPDCQVSGMHRCSSEACAAKGITDSVEGNGRSAVLTPQKY